MQIANRWTLALLISVTFASVICAAASEEVTSAHGQLVYSRKATQQSSSIILKSPKGMVYEFSLVPDFDVKRDVVVLDLVLQGKDKPKNGSNLLDTTGKLHGSQRYTFAASDFTRGAKNSGYGALRVIDLPKLRMQVQIEIEKVSTEPTVSNPSGPLDYQFNDLVLQITLKNLIGEGSTED
jgi:hypothetical protein